VAGGTRVETGLRSSRRTDGDRAGDGAAYAQSPGGVELLAEADGVVVGRVSGVQKAGRAKGLDLLPCGSTS
jgi:hypothetical protein